jgi:hypothetical protein
MFVDSSVSKDSMNNRPTPSVEVKFHALKSNSILKKEAVE